MKNIAPTDAAHLETIETREWLESLDYVLRTGDKGRVDAAARRAARPRARRPASGCRSTATTPYINTISPDEQVPYPGDREIERRIKSLVRWNAHGDGRSRQPRVRRHRRPHLDLRVVGDALRGGVQPLLPRQGRGRTTPTSSTYQGHASPGIYARAFLEGRLTEQHLRNFRHELRPDGGLSSYPHPWLMPEFWEYPTVSMGLGPLMAIYHARFVRYLENRGLKPPSDQKVWAFLGDGETDEPEALGSISLPAREKLDNLIFVINCNLQRLDGPVRGNGQIIQELEACSAASAGT